MISLRISLLLLMCTLSQLAGAQNYVPFPTDSARWKVSYLSGALGCPSVVAEYQYEITGDTFIAPFTYHKISRIGYTNNIFCYPDAWDYAGCIREDTSRHVFFRPPSFSFDTLLYDFNMSVGDTVLTYLNCNCTDAITVGSIDSVLVGSSYRKRFNLDGFTCGSNGFSLIEGIGSTTGLLDCISSFESAGYLECFSLRSQTIYPDTTTICPYLITQVQDGPEDLCEVKMQLHDDCSGVLFFMPRNSCTFSSIEIYDVTSRRVASINCQNEVVFDVSSRQVGSGIFVACFTRSDGFYTALKFVLQ